MPRKYILFDSRSIMLNSPKWDHLMTFSESKRETLRDAKSFGACVCFSYNYVNKDYTDERFELITDSEGNELAEAVAEWLKSKLR